MRVLIVDDHKMVAEGLARLFSDQTGFEVVGVAHDGEAAVQMALQHRPDIVLMDLLLPRLNGIEATRRICSRLPAIRVILCADREDDQHVVAAVRAGAFGFVTKTTPFLVIVKCARSAAAGEPVFTRAHVGLLLGQVGRGPVDQDAERRPCPLTPREREVLELLVAGNTYRAIADALCLSDHTVRSHVQNMQAKLGIANRAQLIGYAVTNRLFDAGTQLRQEPSSAGRAFEPVATHSSVVEPPRWRRFVPRAWAAMVAFGGAVATLLTLGIAR